MNSVKEYPTWVPSIDELRRHVGDADGRKVVLRELDRFDGILAIRERLNSLRSCFDAQKELEAAGIVIPPALAKAAIDEFREKAREELQPEVWRLAVVQLSERVAPSLGKGYARLLKSLRADLDDLRKVTHGIAEKYGAVRERGRTELEHGLEEVIAQLVAESEKPVDFSWHWQPRIALSAYFTESL